VLAQKMAEGDTSVLGVVPDEKALRHLLTSEKLGKDDMVMCFGAGSISAMAKQLAHA
jgi:UDP-N-acetylmuramate-alanine ligase